MSWRSSRINCEHQVVNLPPQRNFVLDERPYYPRSRSHVVYPLNWVKGVQKENSNKTDWRTGHDLTQEADGSAMMRYCEMSPAQEEPSNDKIAPTTHTIKKDGAYIRNGSDKSRSIPEAFNGSAFDLKPATLMSSPRFERIKKYPNSKVKAIYAVANNESNCSRTTNVSRYSLLKQENNYPSRGGPWKILPAPISYNCDSENKEPNNFTSTFEENFATAQEASSMPFGDDKNSSKASTNCILDDHVPGLLKKLPVSIQFQILKRPSSR
uniref:Uncharacterized protein n=1 Tax=Glossina pallidipes TaxID=7398 RepID=A0A1A9ZSG3_GLOPL